jgi:hypothetical protein
MDTSTGQTQIQETAQLERKTYSTPTLVDFGSFAEITNGGTLSGGADLGIYT